jgi:dynein heavy chain
VGKLQEKIVEFQPILEVSQKENAELLVELDVKSKIANETEAVVSKEAAIAQTQADEVNELKTNC